MNRVPVLALPTTAVHESFLAAMDEFLAEGRGGEQDESMIGWEIRTYRDRWRSAAGFAAYVADLHAEADEKQLRPPGIVPCTTLWWLDGTTYLGRLAIRHRLTPRLAEVGGHIGYDVRASARRRGHGTAMLAAALPIARQLGITSALVTCDVENVGSRKIIEANGGTLADEFHGKYRYWVPT
jgi:predicted acetyltransferase